MKLSEFVSEKRRDIYEALSAGRAPVTGLFDEALFREAKDRGQPQMGPVSYQPQHVSFDFIYLATAASTMVLTVQVDAPDLIVYMAVPSWVVEQIWQGDVQGSYHFAREAQELLAAFAVTLAPEANALAFGPSPSFKRQ
jgi:hypothetical protein